MTRKKLLRTPDMLVWAISLSQPAPICRGYLHLLSAVYLDNCIGTNPYPAYRQAGTPVLLKE